MTLLNPIARLQCLKLGRRYEEDCAEVGLQEDTFEAPQSMAQSGKLRTQASRLDDDTRHFEAELYPKSQEHFQFLRGCAGMEGTRAKGKVQVNLHQNFWTWFCQLDPAAVHQCYIDAVALSGEHLTFAADAMKLADEAKITAGWSGEKRANIESIRANAIPILIQFRKLQSTKSFIIREHKSKKSEEEYRVLTQGGSLKLDDKIYCRSLKFHSRLLDCGARASAREMQAVLHRMISRSKHEEEAVVIALKRLQRLHESKGAASYLRT